MTVKDAACCFDMKIQVVRDLCKRKLIPGAKIGKHGYVIPDDTEMILDLGQIAQVLLQIVRKKNDPAGPISRAAFPDDESLQKVKHYLYRLGMIDIPDDKAERSADFDDVMLTDEGLTLLFSAKRDIHMPVTINFSPNLSLAAVNVSGISVGG